MPVTRCTNSEIERCLSEIAYIEALIWPGIPTYQDWFLRSRTGQRNCGSSKAGNEERRRVDTRRAAPNPALQVDRASPTRAARLSSLRSRSSSV
jgi:hypothetical protein